MPIKKKNSNTVSGQTVTNLSRRSIVRRLAAMPLIASVARMASAEESISEQAQSEKSSSQLAPMALKGAQGTKLVLLGTAAGPLLGQRRHMTSHLLVSGGATYVVDCGMTVSDRIAVAGTPFSSIKGIFITHHHPDHNAEYGPLLLMSWMGGHYDELNSYGPPPLDEITDDYLRSIKWTTDLWVKDVHVPAFPKVVAHNIPSAGLVMRDDVVTVTAALAEHPPIVPAYAYRFDFKDRSVVFSGDTVPLDTIAKLAMGADVLVHEAMYWPVLEPMFRTMGAPPGADLEKFRAGIRDHMLRDHTSAEDAGKIAADAGVKTLVLSHLAPGLDRPLITDEQWRSAAAKHYKGQIIVGRDLLVV